MQAPVGVTQSSGQSSQEQVQRGTGRQTGARVSLGEAPRRPGHVEHREREEGKFSVYTAWTVGPLELLAQTFSTTDTRVGSPLTEAE